MVRWKLPGTARDAEAIFSVEEREAIVTMLAENPRCGDVMQGTGGVRQVRVGRGSRGKSGGARVIYIHHDAGHPVCLLAAFAKERKFEPEQGRAKRNRKVREAAFQTG